jgi:GR25 family glycosyltransferase involved in LPS biosynthesis
MINRVYVINLKRRPERLAHFRQECAREGVPEDLVKVWEAVDAQTHRFTEEERKIFESSNVDTTSDTGRGCMANQLSHLQILEDIVDKGVPYSLIFQDDVRFSADFWRHAKQVVKVMKAHPEMQFVWIGLHEISLGSFFKDFDLLNQPDMSSLFITNARNPSHEITIAKLKPEHNPASLAYVVTLEGAREYLHHIRQNGVRHTTDINFREYLLERDAFFGTYPVLCTGNSKFKSDIFKYDHHAVCRDLLELLDDL